MFTRDIYNHLENSQILNLKSFLTTKHEIVIIDHNLSLFLR